MGDDASARYEDVRRKLGVRLRMLRKRNGLTQEAAALRARVTWRHLQRAEAGEANLGLQFLVRLAVAYGVDLYDLFAPSQEESTKPMLAAEPTD